MKRVVPPDAYVQDTGTDKGRAVFAGRDFTKGELIEAAPVLVQPDPFHSLTPLVQRIVYNWQQLTQAKSYSSGLIYGYGSIYNHNNPANMRYEANANDHVMSYYAARDIKKDEELTVNYNDTMGGPVSKRDRFLDKHNRQSSDYKRQFHNEDSLR